MNDPTPPTPDRFSPRATEPFAGGRDVASPRLQCRLATRPDSSPRFTDELSGLLRTRLRSAILIVLAAFVLNLLRDVFLPGATADRRPLWLLFSGGEIAALALVSAGLWSRWPVGLRQLRLLEVLIFGTVAAYIAGLQYDSYHIGFLERAVVKGQEGSVYRLVGVVSVLRWCLVIVLYGTFIPNTWRRCATVVASLAAVPVVLMLAVGLSDPVAGPYVLAALPEMAFVLATAAAIAVFGSHKIRELQEKAHEAERLGQYRLKQVLGFGGMGAVYLAEHVLLRRPCALKLIRPDQAGDPRTLLRFEREVQAMATLTHPNSVEVFDYGHADDGTFYYVMEYLPGLNLEDLVEQHGPLPAERAVHLLRQVCQALREAHGIGLIHRDIKPSNIIACERGRVYDVAKLLDFGLVKGFGPGGDGVKLTQEGTFAGSPAFMSPEQAVGGGQLDARSDIYSIAAVAYFLMTGQLVFDRPSFVQMLHAHAHEPVVPVREFGEAVPADLQRVILRGLEKDPEHRYPDVAALDEALGACGCAGRWTAAKAEDWWRQHGASSPAPRAEEPGARQHASRPPAGRGARSG
jgi:serine/threonine-protein kinase